MLRKIRTACAIVCLLGVTLLFLDFTGSTQPIFGWLAKVQFLPAVLCVNIFAIVAVLVLTLLLGRIYCSVICPLGVTQDIFAWIGKWKIFRKNKKSKHANKYSYSKPKTWLRVSSLALFVVMFVAGFNTLALLLAPYSTYGRMVVSFLKPLYIDANNVLAQMSEANGNYDFYYVEPYKVALIPAITAGIAALILLVLAFRNGRTYCNTICPVGTMLGYVSKFSLFKIKIDENKCSHCGLCAKNCKAACIAIRKGEVSKIDYSRCVVCGNCESACVKGAIKLTAKNPKYATPVQDTQDKGVTPSPAKEETSQNTTVPAQETGNVSRRSFFAIAGTAIAGASLIAQDKTTDGGLAVIKEKKRPARRKPITPPGSLSARNFQQRCTACQLCIANCPNGVLSPSSDLDHLMQPEMWYDKGYCRPECTRCSEVCPTGAIRPITIEKKQATQIGHAVWLKQYCVPFTDKQTCGNCATHCPAGAIQMVPIDKTLKQNPETGEWCNPDGTPVNRRETLMFPAIDTEWCIGCGSCENLCPARPFSAIYVEGHEQHREL